MKINSPNYFQKFILLINKQVEKTSPSYVVFGIFGLLNYPLSHIMWHDVTPQIYSPLSLRVIAVLACIPLVLKDYWPKRLLFWLPIYWYATLLYSLSFFAAFMVLKNHFSLEWIMNSLLGLFLLMLLVDWFSFAILLILGVMLGMLVFLATNGNANFTFGNNAISLAIYMYFFVILINVIFSRNKERVTYEKLQTMRSFGASLAHELRTPLATIRDGCLGLGEFLPKLIKGYEAAEKANLSIEPIRPGHMEILRHSLKDIQEEANFSNTIINMLLIKAKPLQENFYELETCSIKYCIDEALRRYPFFSEEKNLVNWKSTPDFLFKGKELFIIHVIFNLLKNSLQSIKEARKGEIEIWTVIGERENKLYFRDTGKGIAKKHFYKIFERFFTQTQHGSGVGLSFCKMVMENCGGNIVCRSVEGKYAEFILTFPLLPKATQLGS